MEVMLLVILVALMVAVATYAARERNVAVRVPVRMNQPRRRRR